MLNKKHLLAAGALSLLLSGCQGSLAYELMQAAAALQRSKCKI